MVSREKGFSLLEMVIAVGVMSILAGTILPMIGRRADSEKAAIVRKKLLKIAAALEEYWGRVPSPGTIANGGTGGWPTSLTDVGTIKVNNDDQGFFPDSSNNTVFLNPGVTFGSSDYDAVLDDFSPGNQFQYARTTSDPRHVYVWSVGPNGQNDTHSGDDLWVRVDARPIGRRRTQIKMHLLAKYYADFRYENTKPDINIYFPWFNGTCPTNFMYALGGLGEIFQDGFGQQFSVYWEWDDTFPDLKYMGDIVSYGPNTSINADVEVDSIGTGDDQQL